MTDVVLSTLNARYIHAAFGLRYLMANLPKEVRGRASILEFTIHERPLDVVEAIVAETPQVVGFGVYVWNARQTLEVVQALRVVRPELTVVLGGPEVSYETQGQPIVALADYVICGEADLAFAELCEALLAGRRPPQKVWRPPPPRMEEVASPYGLYDEEDVAHRVTYVEASRGCPYRCEFCLSSLPIAVRKVELGGFLSDMEGLMERGVRHFKFVDRTFNLDLRTSRAILEFFLERYEPGMLIHFEMVPDRLPEELREVIARFPDGALQFEVGIQTFDPEVGRRIKRKQKLERLEDNLRFLRDETGVHVHADLIVGLPGEGVEGFGRGFDRLVALGPQEIQVGILKRLKGTPIGRHDEAFGMRYAPSPPFELLANQDVPFEAMRQMERLSRYWDLVANSGNFLRTCPLVWGEGSPFEGMSALSRWLYRETGQTHRIALKRLLGLLFRFLVEERGLQAEAVARSLLLDYMEKGRSDVPKVLRPHVSEAVVEEARELSKAYQRGVMERQSRHAGAG